MAETLFAKKTDLDAHTGSGGGAHADVTTSVDGFMTAADKTKLDGIAALAVALPVADTTSIVEDPVDATKEMRIDVEAVATATTRVLTMPDQDVDLTPSTGTFEAADAGLLSIAGLTTAADRMIYTTALDVYAVATLTQAGRDLIDDANAAAQRTTLGLVIGADVQAEDAGLTSIAALATAADRMIYTTALDVYAVATLTQAGRDLIDDANAAAQRTTLGLVIGTDVQADVITTRGDVIRGSASGAAERLVIGTAGQHLEADGTDAAWVSPDWEIIINGTVSAAASLDFTNLSADFRAYMLVFSNLLPASDGVALEVRTDTNNGASFEAGASDYDWINTTATAPATVAGVGDNADDAIRVTGSMSFTATEEGHGYVKIIDPMNSAVKTGAIQSITYVNSGANAETVQGGGSRLADEANNAVQFLMSAGNITTMTFTFYGLRAS